MDPITLILGATGVGLYYLISTKRKPGEGVEENGVEEDLLGAANKVVGIVNKVIAKSVSPEFYEDDVPEAFGWEGRSTLKQESKVWNGILYTRANHSEAYAPSLFEVFARYAGSEPNNANFLDYEDMYAGILRIPSSRNKNMSNTAKRMFGNIVTGYRSALRYYLVSHFRIPPEQVNQQSGLVLKNMSGLDTTEIHQVRENQLRTAVASLRSADPSFHEYVHNTFFTVSPSYYEEKEYSELEFFPSCRLVIKGEENRRFYLHTLIPRFTYAWIRVLRLREDSNVCLYYKDVPFDAFTRAEQASITEHLFFGNQRLACAGYRAAYAAKGKAWAED